MLADPVTFDPAVVSLVMLTLLEVDEARFDQPLLDRLRDALAETVAVGPDGAALPRIGGRPVTRPVASLMAAALSAAAATTPDPDRDGPAAALRDALWRVAFEKPEVLGLYWLALAHEQASAADVGEPDPADAQTAQRLGDLVDKLIRQQVIEPPELGPDDVLGGFVLQRVAPGAPPTPDWRTAPLLGFLAVAMRDEQITQGRDAYGWLLTASLAARFVAQLTMDRPSCFYARNPADAVGGVRLALWDNTLAIEPNAASLLALVELQETIARLEAPDGP